MFSWLKSQPEVSTDEAKIEELLTRGVEEVIHAESLEKKLRSGKRLRVKLGIDPTSPNLHLGRAVPLLKLRDFQELGHQVILLIGDGTGVIGDTSDKDSERPMLTEAKVQENMRTYFDQAGSVLDIRTVEKRRNSEWLHKLTYDEIGEHAEQFSVADFIARDNIRRRLDSGKRVSLRETLYPLMQGYDSVALKADVELGGTDQRFNLLAGRTLQEHFGHVQQDIVMTPLIDGTDGRKMSSSWGNTINLTEAPTDMYAKVMRSHDDVMPVYFTNLTRVPMGEVTNIIHGLKNGTQNPRDTKMRLAFEIVSLFHNTEVATAAQQEFVTAFQKGEIPGDVEKISARGGETLMEACIRAKLVPSKTEFRRLVNSGAITNKTTGDKVSDSEIEAHPGTYKVGKHRFIEITN